MKKAVVLFFLLVVTSIELLQVHGEPQVPCYFIFGDSLADDGNNNLLPTLAKANYEPYGVDFPEGPTGRFCNGRTIVDILAEMMGFDDYIPPFATANGTEILKGVNYASGGAGILNETGQTSGARICMDEQLNNHQVTVSSIVSMLGSSQSATEYLNKCFYSVGMGDNDYINNYFQPDYYPSSLLYTPEQFAKVLIEQFSQQIETLYNYGARKIVLFGVGMLGCTPNAISVYGTNGSTCVEFMNYESSFFNVELKSLVDDLNTEMPDATFIYVDAVKLAEDVIAAAFNVTTVGCCEVEELTGLCIPNQTPCQNRSEYAFWDSFHPSEAANLISAIGAYSVIFPSEFYTRDKSLVAEL
ncbi:hypothetical protein F2P56_009105 [Juglans regia]|uniref:GDSL esterase/lipase At1g29670-like n=2 Tax=Juglans regia TaxID=51240 RepID=A0A2I4HP38_JUGRE|nr:GDSL esterase/lipase At1g29670-like [Juglans regia]KAF5472383.1 hypothetical protein F2P56_009105 [Juglans regia]